MCARSKLAFLALALATFGGLVLTGQSCIEAQKAPLAGDLDLCADTESLKSRLFLERRGSSRLGLLLDEKEEGTSIVGSFEFADEDAKVRMAAGPGTARGALRLLVDPAYLSFGLNDAPGVETDAALSSGTAVLGLEYGALSAFALERGAKAGLILPRSGSISSDPEAPPPPTAGAAGLGLSLPCGSGDLISLASVSLRSGSSGGEGWRPEPAPDAAGQVFDLGILKTSHWDSGWAAVGLAASQGRLEGPGLAARIEAEERRGPVSLEAAAGVAGPGFRGLYGSRPAYELGTAADLRLALRRAATLGLGLRMRAKPRLPADAAPAAPGWEPGAAERSAKLSFAAPLPSYGRSFELLYAAERGTDGSDSVAIALGLLASERTEAGVWRRRWGAELRFGGPSGPGFAGLRASLSAFRSPPGGSFGPTLEFGLDLDLLEAGCGEAPALADLGIGLALPLSRTADFGISLDFPSPGLRIDRLDAAPAGKPELSLSYSCRW